MIRWTRYGGREALGWPVATIMRGAKVMVEGALVAPHGGEAALFA